jgi:hypothetical protein
MTLGPRQAVFRASCEGVQVRLRVNPDESWIIIRRPGAEPFYADIPQDQVAAVLAELEAIGEDPEKFKAFVSTIEAQFAAATTL